jgi:histidinol-phosphatase
MNRDLALALSLADASDAITMKHFRTSFEVRTKSDRTPVTEVDEAVERLIREQINTERPGDGILGEEFGATGSSRRRWIIDPIDATRNYIRGIPIFATLIALQENGGKDEDGHLTVGVVSAPALHRRWWAARGEGAFCNGEPIRVSSVTALPEAHLSYDDLAGFTKADVELRFLAFVRACGRTRAFGDFWSHMLVAEGAIDVAIEPEVALWDLAALQIIIEEAGGRFTSLGGIARPDRGSAVSTNGVLHDAVLAAFR